MPNYLADGLGGTTGDSLATESTMLMSGVVWYVSSAIGSDSSTYGRSREAPTATLAYALTLASAGDTIVVLGDHDETVTTAIDITIKLTIVGEGSASGNPTASFTCNVAGSVVMLTVTADDVEIRNIRFKPNIHSSGNRVVSWIGERGRMRGCYSECGQYNTPSHLLIGSDYFEAENCTWIVTSTTLATRPPQAILTQSSGLTRLSMRNCIISGGTSGWTSTTGAMSVADSTMEIRCEAMSLLLGSDVFITAGVTGFFSIGTATGGAQVRWG